MKIMKGLLLNFTLCLLSACSSLSGPNEQEAQEADAYAKISQSHFNDKHYPEAMSSIDHALSLDPDNSNYQMSKGLIYFKMERFNDAVSWVSKACEKSQSPECWNNYSALLNAQRKYKEAIKMADKALAVATYSTPEYAVINKSEALLGLKRNYDAKSILKGTLKNNPNDCTLRIHLARAQVRDKAFEDALELNTFTRKICPQSALPSLWEAYIFYKTGNTSKSRYSLEMVIKYFPKSAQEEWARNALEKMEQRVPLEEPPVDFGEKGV